MIWRSLGLVIVFLSVAAVALADGDEITVKQYVQTDFTPPTTPVIASTTPITYSQIDIVWGAVTDDVAVGGYVVYRGSSSIATTTLTTYSDTGLLASTTYSYTIVAFDTASNYSSSSAASATTTLVAPTSTPTTTPSGGSNGGSSGIDLVNLTIETDEHSALFNWQTNKYARFTFRYGRTSSYELGFVVNDIYKREHLTEVNDLEPGTTYEYELIAYDRRGVEYELSSGQFETKASADVSAPANVSNLRAEVIGSDVRLSWVNPTADDFSHIRILRSHLFFPSDPADGFLVYQGDGTEVVDQNAFTLSPNQYYSVFSYDDKGNISSGAVVWVSELEGVVTVTNIPISEIPTTTTATTAIPVLDFSDVEFIQRGEVLLPNASGQFDVDGQTNLTVRVPYESVPEHLKTITVTLAHPEDENMVFSFLLRVNKDKSAYEATMAPLQFDGLFGVMVDVFDFKTEVLSRVSGELDSNYRPAVVTDNNRQSYISPLQILIITSGAFLLFLVLFFLIMRRSQSSNGE